MRLIDADKAYKRLMRYTNNQHALGIKETLDAVPTVNPVKRGHWKRAKAYPNIIICDECGEAFEQRGHWNYCPNCGAMMDDACGRWHKQGDEYRCSECGDTTIVAYKNCPNCGARMEDIADA